MGRGRWRRCLIAVSGGYAEARKGKGKGLLGGKEKEMNLSLEELERGWTGLCWFGDWVCRMRMISGVCANIANHVEDTVRLRMIDWLVYQKRLHSKNVLDMPYQRPSLMNM